MRHFGYLLAPLLLLASACKGSDAEPLAMDDRKLFNHLLERMDDVDVRATVFRKLSDEQKIEFARQLLRAHPNPGSKLYADLTLPQKQRFLTEFFQELQKQAGSSLYNLSIFRTYGDALKKYRTDIKDQEIIEIGPGENLSVGLLFALAGAARYSGVDIYKASTLYDREYYEPTVSLAKLAIPNELAARTDSEVFKYSGSTIELNPERVAYLHPFESYAFPFPPNHADYVFSNSGFEHFNEPKKTIEKIFEVLKPGAITAHSIDLRDHRNFSEPYNFLKFDDKAWRAQFNEENLYLYTNRWRAIDFKKAFVAAGFEIVEYKADSAGAISESQKATFDKGFQPYSVEDLAATHLWIVLRKPDRSS